jgi:hypothetical protein
MCFTPFSQFAGAPTTTTYWLSESEFGTCTSTLKLPLMCLISAPLVPMIYTAQPMQTAQTTET